ncbi:MAG: SWIM zinc finger family protein [Verrucomicrobiota bacterium]|jgi:uncharacterized Zn finger protein|nr:SWIM zinc finger family protein [Verrucomicrobiota bacterium]
MSPHRSRRPSRPKQRPSSPRSFWSEQDSPFSFYPVAKPIEVKAGIKAQSTRGEFASQWWGKKWIQAIEQMPVGSRLQRGRNYARKGQVTDLTIEPGNIFASVQGTRQQPYRINIQLPVISRTQWDAIIDRIAQKPALAIGLISGVLSIEIQEICTELAQPLLPQNDQELVTNCSCPDWANPCKHIAAVFYLVAEALDHDPFLLLQLRGINKVDFIDRLKNTLQPIEQVSYQPDEPNDKNPEDDVTLLPRNPEIFWATSLLPPPKPLGERPIVPATQIKKLGAIPFWRSEQSLLQAMEYLYDIGSMTAQDRLNEFATQPALREQQDFTTAVEAAPAPDEKPPPHGRPGRRRS